MTPKAQFNKRASKLIQQAIRQRLFLIETGKSRNFVTWQQCKTVHEEISRLRSDRQFAKYVVEKKDLLLNMVPGNNSNNTFPLRMLIEEATQTILP